MKTVASDGDVAAFLASRPRAADARTLAALMADVSDHPAVMWGPAIVGFDRYVYPLANGRSGEICRIGFSPRAAALAIYGAGAAPGRERLLSALGKVTTGKACIYIKSLANVDMAVLRDLIAAGLAENRARYPASWRSRSRRSSSTI